MRQTLGSLALASVLSTYASARSVLVHKGQTAFPEELLAQSDCLSTSYFGTYGQALTHVFVSEPECLDTLGTSFKHSFSTTVRESSRDEDHKLLCWLEEALLDDSIRQVGAKSATEEISEFIQRVNGAPEYGYTAGQTPMASDASEAVSVLYSTPTGALVSLSPSLLAELDMLLPSYIKPTLLPTSPLPLSPDSEKIKPSTKFLRSVLAQLKFNPDIAAITSTLSFTHMQQNIRWLTGEDSDSPIISRHSFSPGARTAANWIQKRIEQAGAECKQKPFLDGFAPNVVCRFMGTDNTTGLVILSAHYGTFL